MRGMPTPSSPIAQCSCNYCKPTEEPTYKADAYAAATRRTVRIQQDNAYMQSKEQEALQLLRNTPTTT